MFLGCQVRTHLFGIKIAEVLKEELSRDDFARPYKQFVFGTLTFNTENALPNDNGVQQVAWHHHVASVIRLAETPSQLYILDPGISGKPILRDVWYQMLVKNRDTTSSPGKWGDLAKISGQITCKPDTIYEFDDCFNPNLATDHDDIVTELEFEIRSLLELYDLINEIHCFKDTHHNLKKSLIIYANSGFVCREWVQQKILGRVQLGDMAQLGDIGIWDTKYYP